MTTAIIHIQCNDGSETLCGQTVHNVTMDAGFSAQVNCPECIAHWRCRRGIATDQDRVLLSHVSVLDRTWTLGPIEWGSDGRHYRWRWPTSKGRARITMLRIGGTLDAWTNKNHDTIAAPRPDGPTRAEREQWERERRKSPVTHANGVVIFHGCYAEGAPDVE